MATFLIAGFIIFLFIYLMEIHFCEKISSFYFSNGLIIYKKLLDIGDSDNLNIEVIQRRIGSGFKYNIHPNGIIYFREQHFTWWPGINLMRGTIVIRNNNAISILGRLNLSPIVFSILLMALLLHYGKTEMYSTYGILLIIFYFLIVYLVPKRRFNQIAHLIEGK